MAGALGRIEPPDFEHIEKYPITALAAPERPVRVPVIVGVNWYREFDTPQQDSKGIWWVARDGKLTRVRGGHCIVFYPVGISEPSTWWGWFNQVDEGICVGEGSSRAMSWLNRTRYQPRWLYDRCKERDGYAGEGTWVRVALDVMREVGLVKAKRSEKHILQPGLLDDREPDINAGIAANRWATSDEDWLAALGAEGRDYVDYANSWGRGYPRRVRMPVAVASRLRQEDGEFGMITDR